jgi:hypothetical protein
MTKQEFIQQYHASTQASNRRGWIAIAVLFGTVIVGISVLPFLWSLVQKGYFDWVTSINEYSLWGVLGCGVLAMAFASRNVSTSYGVYCQVCGKRLYRTSARLALITNNCGFCGEKIFDDGDPCSADMLRRLKTL